MIRVYIYCLIFQCIRCYVVYNYSVVKNHNEVAVQIVFFFYMFIIYKSMSVCMYIFYLVVVLRDKLKITAVHLYGSVKYNFMAFYS